MSQNQDVPQGGLGTMKEVTYRGHSLEVERTDERDNIGGHAFEFRLHIDGGEVTTASSIESGGWSNPWIPALVRYGKAYIDGLKA